MNRLLASSGHHQPWYVLGYGYDKLVPIYHKEEFKCPPQSHCWEITQHIWAKEGQNQINPSHIGNFQISLQPLSHRLKTTFISKSENVTRHPCIAHLPQSPTPQPLHPQPKTFCLYINKMGDLDELIFLDCFKTVCMIEGYIHLLNACMNFVCSLKPMSL